MAAKRKFDHDAIIDAYISGMSYKTIKKKYGCRPDTIRSIVRRFGLLPRSILKSRRTELRDDTPSTAVAIDGYLLPDEESASIFRRISARKRAIDDTLVLGEPFEDNSFVIS